MTHAGRARNLSWWRASRHVYDRLMSGAGRLGLRRSLGAAAGLAQAIHLVVPRTPAPHEVASLIGDRVRLAPDAAARAAREISILRYQNRALSAIVARQGLAPLAALADPAAVARLKALRDIARPTVLLTWHAGPIFGLAALLSRAHVRALIVRTTAAYDGGDTLEFAYTAPGFARRSAALLRATERLRDGGLVLVAADGPDARPMLEIRSFGRVVPLARGPFALARLTGALVIPLAPRWSVTGTLGVVVGEPLPRPPLECGAADAFERALAQSSADWFEGYVASAPGQLWLYTLRRLLACPAAGPVK